MDTSPVQQARFDTGHEVGILATRLYPGGVFIEEDYFKHGDAVRSTLAAMSAPEVTAIYEAAFVHDGVRIRVDILERSDDERWNLIEVKSSTSVKDEHLPDVAIQYHVLRGAGLTIDRAALLHLDKEYVYDGRQYDLEALFSFSDLSDEVVASQAEIPARIAELKAVLEADRPPDVAPSRRCTNPHECEFYEHCTSRLPEFWVMQLSGIRQSRLDELTALGIDDIREIPGSFPLDPLQERIRACVVGQREFIAPELESVLNEVEYPIHFLDFETVNPAIPKYVGTSPYQQIPFQWSDHVLLEDGSLEHRKYLCDEDKDPREEFATTLLETLEEKGTIIVWHASFEKGIIAGLADHSPHFRERLLALLTRFQDLKAVTKEHFYHPGFYGSFSLKSVLPALVPSMTYQDLEVQEGDQAAVEYLRMVNPTTPPEDKAKIREALLAYCGHDTLGMVRIREELLKRL